jgi:hypothetical protein
MQVINNILSEMVQSVVSGQVNALEPYAILKTLEKYVKKCIDEVEPYAMREAEKHSEKTFAMNGYQFEKRNGYLMYDYSANADYAEMENKLKAFKETLTKVSKLGKTVVDEDTGEVIQPLPVKGGTKDSLIIKKIQ